MNSSDEPRSCLKSALRLQDFCQILTVFSALPGGKYVIFNESARALFDTSAVDGILPLNEYPIWSKRDPFGRVYYGVSHFWGMDNDIDENTDLSWLEWDGNEIHIDGDDMMSVFSKTVGIAKAWAEQTEREFAGERFVIFAAFDDGSELIEGPEPYYGFTMRFWKLREGQGMNENIDSDQPLIKWIIA